MPSLHELQKMFADFLNRENDDVLQHVQSSEHLSAQEHVAIYQNSVRGALQNGLKEIYPVCLKLVGEDFFLMMADEYIDQTPSHSSDLGHYGEDFADFIATFPPAESLPYLPDTVRLEWAWHTIYDAANTTRLDFQKLAACYNQEGGNIVFALPPASVLLSSPYPIHQIWEMNQADYTGEDQLTLRENQQYYLFIWRSRSNLRIDLLTELEWNVLQWIQNKLPLGQICSNLHNEYPNDSIAEILPQFISRGWLADFFIQNKPVCA